MNELKIHGFSETQMEDVVENELFEKENEVGEEVEKQENVQLRVRLKINEGDIFVQDDLTVMLNVLEITEVLGSDPIYRVRLMATDLTPFSVIEVELYDYLVGNELVKLKTYHGENKIGAEFAQSDSLKSDISLQRLYTSAQNI